MSLIFCHGCGKQIHNTAPTCPECGAVQPNNVSTAMPEKSRIVALLLCFFLGLFGAHRFYSKHIGIGIIQLLTGGGFLIWALIDFIMLLIGNYKDADGKVMK